MKLKLLEKYEPWHVQTILYLLDPKGWEIARGFGANKKERKKDLIKELKEKQAYTNSLYKEYYKFLGVK